MKNLIAFVLGLAVLTTGQANAAKKEKATTIEVIVGSQGFEPKEISVKPGTEVSLKITRKTDVTCSKEIQVPSRGIKIELPLGKPVVVALGRLKEGEIKFGCGMDMMDAGRIFVK